MTERLRYLFRARYWRGHNIHSPFVYRLVREVLMPCPNRDITPNDDLYNTLTGHGISPTFALRTAQLHTYLGYTRFETDPPAYREGTDLVLLTAPAPEEAEFLLREMGRTVTGTGKQAALAVCRPYRNRKLKKWWQEQHTLQIDLWQIGIIIVDDNLNPQRYKLRIRK